MAKVSLGLSCGRHVVHHQEGVVSCPRGGGLVETQPQGWPCEKGNAYRSEATSPALQASSRAFLRVTHACSGVGSCLRN
eukprot:148720-Amphidinium_carterae.1